ncbi:hypothetical protein EVAR_96076_1 [Eumeta japonica]|uniref:Uncharacterized protein n=1 Tax=Eumeta variegata TaxID=151549 RepID=A0A4C1W9A5_EUMVA|nr:hypothetical protein EVAR_96076_1 [Eumeta japonica]
MTSFPTQSIDIRSPLLQIRASIEHANRDSIFFTKEISRECFERSSMTDRYRSEPNHTLTATHCNDDTELRMRCKVPRHDRVKVSPLRTLRWYRRLKSLDLKFYKLVIRLGVLMVIIDATTTTPQRDFYSSKEML